MTAATPEPIDPLQRVPGVAESALPNAIAALLPPTSPPAPWETVADVVVWLHRAAPGAKALLPSALAGRRTVPLTVGALVRYHDTPVGPYGELFAAPVLLAEAPRLVASIPFIAVDSIASIRAGRELWALPKTLARMTFGPGSAAAVGGGWRVDARIQARQRTVPLRMALRDRQPQPDGGTALIDVAIRARAHLGRVALDAEGPTLPDWLMPGPHAALVAPGARLRVGAPRAGR